MKQVARIAFLHLEDGKKNMQKKEEQVMRDLLDNAPELFFFACLNFDVNALTFTWSDYCAHKDQYPKFSDKDIFEKAETAMNRCQNIKQYPPQSRNRLAISAIHDLCHSAYLSGRESFSDLEKITNIQADEMRGWFMSYMDDPILKEAYARSNAYPYGSAASNRDSGAEGTVVKLPVQKYQRS